MRTAEGFIGRKSLPRGFDKRIREAILSGCLSMNFMSAHNHEKYDFPADKKGTVPIALFVKFQHLLQQTFGSMIFDGESEELNRVPSVYAMGSIRDSRSVSQLRR